MTVLMREVGTIRPEMVERALSLTQPWATLMAAGHKTYETRSWPTHFRGWLAIHAAKGFPGECKRLCYEQPFRAALEEIGYDAGHKELPCGAVLCVVRVIDCLPAEDARQEITGREAAFGDYSIGRYAFVTTERYALRRPFAIPGKLGLWRLPTPLYLRDLEPCR